VIGLDNGLAGRGRLGRGAERRRAGGLGGDHPGLVAGRWLVALVAAAAVVAAAFALPAAGSGGPGGGAAPAPGPSATQAPPGPDGPDADPADPADPASPADPAGADADTPQRPAEWVEPWQVEEGVDYSFLTTSLGTRIPTWTCDTDIPLVLAEPYPAGAEESLEWVAETAEQASALPLEVAAPEAGLSGTRPGDIVIFYRLPGEAVDVLGIELETDVIGRGGPAYNDERILSGIVVIRTDMPEYLPSTDAGRLVLLHEVMHALGAGHASEAKEGAEVMAPYTDASKTLQLGLGDRFVLQELGCW
jgi:hypothetical protein